MRRKRTCSSTKFPFKSAIAALSLASASLVGGQPLQILYSFGFDAPPSGLTLGYDGNFYGTTVVGGGSDTGTAFKLTTNGMYSRLVSFIFTNGYFPRAALTLGNDGSFYGTTSSGGSSGSGTVFKVTTNGTLTTLVSFSGSDGSNPQAALTLGNDGQFLRHDSWRR